MALQIATKKVVRLAGGRYITRKLMESTPESVRVARADQLWMTADERVILIADMELRHLLNAIHILEVRAMKVMKEFGLDGDHRAFAGQLDRRYLTMTEELKRRSNGGSGRQEIHEATTRKFEA